MSGRHRTQPRPDRLKTSALTQSPKRLRRSAPVAKASPDRSAPRAPRASRCHTAAFRRAPHSARSPLPLQGPRSSACLKQCGSNIFAQRAQPASRNKSTPSAPRLTVKLAASRILDAPLRGPRPRLPKRARVFSHPRLPPHPWLPLPSGFRSAMGTDELVGSGSPQGTLWIASTSALIGDPFQPTRQQLSAGSIED